MISVHFFFFQIPFVIFSQNKASNKKITEKIKRIGIIIISRNSNNTDIIFTKTIKKFNSNPIIPNSSPNQNSLKNSCFETFSGF